MFFGLWLIPMGVCVLRSGSMPRPSAGCSSPAASATCSAPSLRYVVPDADALAASLAIPASVGEFWMIGYLLLRGLGRRDPTPVRPAVAATGG